MPKPKITRLERTAYHEAGHAVVAYLNKSKFQRISIIREGDTLGMIIMEDPWLVSDEKFVELEYSPHFAKWVEKRISILLAGSVSEMILLGHRPRDWFCQQDMDHAIGYSFKGNGSGEAAGAYVDYLWWTVRDQLAFPEHWAAVKALAGALLESQTIGYYQARSIIETAISGPPSKKPEIVLPEGP